MKISIIIPTFNRKDFIRNLLFQLKNQIDLIDDVDFEQVVVVDGSTDGTLEMMKIDFPYVHVVTGNGNWWYTKSMNEGFKFASKHLNPDFYLTLNDDIFLSNDYLKVIVQLAVDNNRDTIYGSLGVTNDKPHRIVTSGNLWKNMNLGIYKSHLKFLSEVELDKITGIYPSLTLPGRGMLIPYNIMRALNYFDEDYKQYHSDGDFTLRAIKSGFKVFISWDAKIFVNLLTTSASTSFFKKKFSDIIKSFFNPTSRNYLPAKSKFIWRHNKRIYFIPILLLFIFLTVRKNLKKPK